jgi:tagaturonate reductase
MMHLSKKMLDLTQNAATRGTVLPEKVLQFGTGVLLRGLPDYYIDQANKQNLFGGRIVLVKSTDSGEIASFSAQDGLFTHCIRGIDQGKKVERNIINGAISRVLSAKDNWQAVLACAANPELQVIVSNTTEVGISLVKEDINKMPPASFPGKLLAFLYQRYVVFGKDPSKGFVIIPTELIPANAEKLLSILDELAQHNGLEAAFTDWMHTTNYFCNSLVDRIVPGRLPVEKQTEMEWSLGYQDALMIMSEVYGLWAIESADVPVKNILSFYKADNGVVITPDISTFRDLKLRLLNGSHTFSCGLALLAGFDTVRQAMDNPDFEAYIRDLMLEEIAPAITGEKISVTQAREFSLSVLDRFRNPYIAHLWINITLQYTSKMAMRNVPVIIESARRFGHVPARMSLGFAACLLFMRTEKSGEGKYSGSINRKKYDVQDDHCAYFSEQWQHENIDTMVNDILSEQSLWKADLAVIPGFSAAVIANLHQLIDRGAAFMLTQIREEAKKNMA